MPNPGVQTAVCMCSFGAAPGVLTVSSNQTVKICKMLAATIMDNKFPSFGMCSCPANPAVIAATAAALGVPTPAPCTPAIAAPWAAGVPLVNVCKKPLMSNQNTLLCSYGGVIKVQVTPALLVNDK